MLEFLSIKDSTINVSVMEELEDLENFNSSNSASLSYSKVIKDDPVSLPTSYMNGKTRSLHLTTLSPVPIFE
jgi:hypothetical protein